ncbi:DUF6262 family protein [Streptomyces europaeiscabiei]|uniref:DUF6262 family protein n=1 Tax=Streptomyces europaeiscabiei TaxID=146819 RepID=UPI0029B9398A|nr:DUF6262 family protein [Streptomyces europaeiscabiei]MDX2760417.1 DUF6262 family protein [Streptomyces europaeiscabiei]
MARTPTEVLAASRRADSLRKRQRALDVVQSMLADGEHITFTTVARTAKVSTWLVYAEGVREYIEAAIRQQEHEPVVARSSGRQSSPASLKSDLMMAREEITALRQERDRLRDAVRQQLGHQLDQVSSRQLTERITELTDANRRLEQETAQLQPLKDQVAELEKDLAAARTSLRQMIRAENQNR